MAERISKRLQVMDKKETSGPMSLYKDGVLHIGVDLPRNSQPKSVSIKVHPVAIE